MTSRVKPPETFPLLMNKKSIIKHFPIGYSAVQEFPDTEQDSGGQGLGYLQWTGGDSGGESLGTPGSCVAAHPGGEAEVSIRPLPPSFPSTCITPVNSLHTRSGIDTRGAL